MIINNVELDSVNRLLEQGKKDKSTLKKIISIDGEWILDAGKGYQFRAEMAYEKGRQVIEIDSPTWLGGQGNRLGPMSYCIAGISSCFMATVASIAAMKGVRLKRLNVKARCTINFAKTLDLADEPITEGVSFDVDADAENASKEELRSILRLAEDRCPALYSMKNVVRTEVRLL